MPFALRSIGQATTMWWWVGTVSTHSTVQARAEKNGNKNGFTLGGGVYVSVMGQMHPVFVGKDASTEITRIDFESDESSQFDCHGSKCERQITTRQQWFPLWQNKESWLLDLFCQNQYSWIWSKRRSLCFGGDAIEKWFCHFGSLFGSFAWEECLATKTTDEDDQVFNTSSYYNSNFPPYPSLQGVTLSQGPSTGPSQVVTELGICDRENPRMELGNRGLLVWSPVTQHNECVCNIWLIVVVMWWLFDLELEQSSSLRATTMWWWVGTMLTHGTVRARAEKNRNKNGFTLCV
jgi:hypothetical protein